MRIKRGLLFSWCEINSRIMVRNDTDEVVSNASNALSEYRRMLNIRTFHYSEKGT